MSRGIAIFLVVGVWGIMLELALMNLILAG
jgi:hypothetical protein